MGLKLAVNKQLSLNLRTGQIEASTSLPGIPRAFDCASCPGREDLNVGWGI